MFRKINYSVVVIVDICIISNSIIVYIINLGRIDGECVNQVNNAIAVVVSIGIVPNTVKVGVGIFVGIEWEGILSIGGSIAIGIDFIGIRLESDFLTITESVIVGVGVF